jgi:hypothetical protein
MASLGSVFALKGQTALKASKLYTFLRSLTAKLLAAVNER